jgi:hypothetical protein
MNYKRLPMMIPLAGALIAGAAGCGGLENKLKEHDAHTRTEQAAPQKYNSSAAPVAVERTAGNTWAFSLGDDQTQTDIPVHLYNGTQGINGELLFLMRAYAPQNFPQPGVDLNTPDDARVAILNDPAVQEFIQAYEIRQGRQATLDIQSNYEKAAAQWDITPTGDGIRAPFGAAIAWLVDHYKDNLVTGRDHDEIRYTVLIPGVDEKGIYANTPVTILTYTLKPKAKP